MTGVWSSLNVDVVCHFAFEAVIPPLQGEGEEVDAVLLAVPCNPSVVPVTARPLTERCR